MIDFNNPVVWALIGTLFGGSGLAVVNKLLSRGKDKTDFAAEIRSELRTDIKRYQDEVAGYKKETAALREEVDSWRNKYYELIREHETDLQNMQGEIDELHALLDKNGIDHQHK